MIRDPNRTPSLCSDGNYTVIKENVISWFIVFLKQSFQDFFFLFSISWAFIIISPLVLSLFCFSKTFSSSIWFIRYKNLKSIPHKSVPI